MSNISTYGTSLSVHLNITNAWGSSFALESVVCVRGRRRRALEFPGGARAPPGAPGPRYHHQRRPPPRCEGTHCGTGGEARRRGWA